MKCPAGRAPVPVPRLRGEPAWRRGAHPEGFSEPWRMGQAWVAGEPPGFAAGSVSMAWAPGALFAHALLPDEEVFSGSTADGQRLWTLGDVFEVFAWREGAEGYVELHVSPNGHQAHLRWTAADFQRVRAGEAVVEDFAGSARGRLKRLRSFGPEAAGGQRECGYRRLCCLAGGRWRRVSGWLCRSAGMTPGGAAAGRFCLRRRRTRFRRFTVWRSGGRFSWRDERARGGRGRRAAAGGWRSGNFF